MLNFYSYNHSNQKIQKQSKYKSGCWVEAIEPTDAEIELLIKKAHAPADYVRYGLDQDESARFESDPESKADLVIFDVPILQKQNHDNDLAFAYTTKPLGFIVTTESLITVSSSDFTFLKSFEDNKIANFNPENKTYSLLQMFYQITVSYLENLRTLNRQRAKIERNIQKSLKNEELYGLLDIQRSLVYFMMSLQTDGTVLNSIKRLNFLNIANEYGDYLDDILIENQQGIEMAEITDRIINQTTDTYSSIINNNMNSVMKFLTAYSIILTIPTLVFSFYGMNVKLPLASFDLSWIITIIISLLLAVILIVRFLRNHYF